MKLYEAVARAIRLEGSVAVFGLMGDGNLKLIPCLSSEVGVPFYGARHESGAIAMADAYARVSGEVGVCTVTQGPGVVNALTALISAHRGGTPLVVLCGDTPTTVRGLPQELDEIRLLSAADLAIQNFDPSAGPGSVLEAFERARAEGRPVVLVLPTDVQEAEWDGPVQVAASPSAPITPLAPESGSIEAAVAAIDSAQKPLVVAGRGALRSDAKQAIISLADRIGALLATSLPAKGWFGAHPFHIGIAGGFASEAARGLMNEADCVITFGAGLNHFTTRGSTLFGHKATIVQCDTDTDAFGRYTRVDITIPGDARAVAQALTERVSEGSGYRTADVAERIPETRRETFSDEGVEGALDPRVICVHLDEMLPPKRILVVDGGHFMGFPSSYMGVSQPSDYVFTLDFGSIGLGLGAAVGAAVASPGTPVVCAVGDGGFMMSLGELDTAIRYQLPIVVAVFNDGAYGAEMHFLRMLGLPDAEALFEIPSLARVAQALGAEALTIASLRDLEAAREQLADLRGPLLLDCRVSQDVRATWLAEAFERGTH